MSEQKTRQPGDVVWVVVNYTRPSAFNLLYSEPGHRYAAVIGDNGPEIVDRESMYDTELDALKASLRRAKSRERRENQRVQTYESLVEKVASAGDGEETLGATP